MKYLIALIVLLTACATEPESSFREAPQQVIIRCPNLGSPSTTFSGLIIPISDDVWRIRGILQYFNTDPVGIAWISREFVVQVHPAGHDFVSTFGRLAYQGQDFWIGGDWCPLLQVSHNLPASVVALGRQEVIVP